MGQAPAFARVAHGALERSAEVVDEDVMLLPGELVNLAVEDGKALAEVARTVVAQPGHGAVGRDRVEPGMPADRAGALVKLAVAPFEALREADLAAHDLGRDFEAQIFRPRAIGRVGGAREGKRDEEGEGAKHAGFYTGRSPFVTVSVRLSTPGSIFAGSRVTTMSSTVGLDVFAR